MRDRGTGSAAWGCRRAVGLPRRPDRVRRRSRAASGVVQRSCSRTRAKFARKYPPGIVPSGNAKRSRSDSAAHPFSPHRGWSGTGCDGRARRRPRAPRRPRGTTSRCARVPRRRRGTPRSRAPGRAPRGRRRARRRDLRRATRRGGRPHGATVPSRADSRLASAVSTSEVRRSAAGTEPPGAGSRSADRRRSRVGAIGRSPRKANMRATRRNLRGRERPMPPSRGASPNISDPGDGSRVAVPSPPLDPVLSQAPGST